MVKRQVDVHDHRFRPTMKGKREPKEDEHCVRPYCKGSVEEQDPICRACGAELDYYSEEDQPLPRRAEPE
jgi:hypothetical protein